MVSVFKFNAAHPRIRLFIMHGGLNGLIEAAQQGVPVIVVPFFVDQFRNGRLAEKRGMGKVFFMCLLIS